MFDVGLDFGTMNCLQTPDSCRNQYENGKQRKYNLAYQQIDLF